MARTGRPARLESLTAVRANLSGSARRARTPSACGLERAKIVRARMANHERGGAGETALFDVTVGKWGAVYDRSRGCADVTSPSRSIPPDTVRRMSSSRSSWKVSRWQGSGPLEHPQDGRCPRWRQCLHRGLRIGLAHLRVAAAAVVRILQDLRRPAVPREGAIVGLYLQSTRPRRSCEPMASIQALGERSRLPADGHIRVGPNARRTTVMDLFGATSRPARIVAQTKKSAHRSRDFVERLATIDERVDPTLTSIGRDLSTISRCISPRVPSNDGWPATRASSSTLRQPTSAGSTSSSGSLPPHRTSPQARLVQHAQRCDAISAYVDAHNDEGKPGQVAKTCRRVLAKVKRSSAAR